MKRVGCAVDVYKRQGMISADEVAILSEAIADFKGKHLYIDDNSNMTVPEMRAKCHRLQGDRKLDLVVVDYLQLMQGSRRVESRQQEISEISRSLKRCV